VRLRLEARLRRVDLAGKGKRSMRMVAYLLGIICIIAAIVYFVMPAGSLPTFMPGYEAGSAHMHVKHALIALAAAVILFVAGWLIGRRA
jgi:hypothetical protein